MIYSLYIPIVIACLIAAAGPRVARQLAPAAATRLLTALAAISALATVGSLVLLAIGGIIKMAPLLGLGVSRERLVDGKDGVPWVVGAAALVTLTVVAIRTISTARRERHAFFWPCRSSRP